MEYVKLLLTEITDRNNNSNISKQTATATKTATATTTSKLTTLMIGISIKKSKRNLCKMLSKVLKVFQFHL